MSLIWTGQEKPASQVTANSLRSAMEQSERKAWDALSRYKFWMFGYHAAAWVQMNRVGGFKQPNPWRGLVQFVRDRKERPA